MNETKIPVWLGLEELVIIPRALIKDKDAEAGDILTYLAFTTHAGGRQWATPTQKEIMKLARYSCRQTIGKKIAHLIEIGWATNIHRYLNRPNIVLLHGRKRQKFSQREINKIRSEIEENGQ